MRDPKRIRKICDALAEAWLTEPDFRLGQLLSLFENSPPIFFYKEDDIWYEQFKEFTKLNTND